MTYGLSPIERVQLASQERERAFAVVAEKGAKDPYAVVQVSKLRWRVIKRVTVSRAYEDEIGIAQFEFITEPLDHLAAWEHLRTMRLASQAGGGQ